MNSLPEDDQVQRPTVVPQESQPANQENDEVITIDL